MSDQHHHSSNHQAHHHSEIEHHVSTARDKDERKDKDVRDKDARDKDERKDKDARDKDERKDKDIRDKDERKDKDARHPRRRRRLLLALVLALLLLLLLGGTVFANTSASITLILEQHTLSESVIVYQHAQSIQAKGSLTQTIQTSNVYVPGQNAYGQLTFHSAYTGCGCATVVPAGTVFRGADGVSVMTLGAAILGPYCTATVPAESLQTGLMGNIRAYDIYTTYSRGISVTNGASFGGGTNGYWHPVVQQQSINATMKSLTAQLRPQVLAALAAQQKSANIVLLSHACSSHAYANHQVGESAKNVSINVTMTCSGQGYNASTVQTAAEQVLIQQVQETLGSDYALTQMINNTVSNAVLTDAKTGTILLTVSTQGRWTYQLSKAQQQEIVHMLAGKDGDDARAFLKEQRGIQSASIVTNGVFTQNLPLMSGNIHLVMA